MYKMYTIFICQNHEIEIIKLQLGTALHLSNGLEQSLLLYTEHSETFFKFHFLKPKRLTQN